jgi:hypothetical protein
MELEERLPLIKIKWLATFTLQQFEENCITKKTKKADIYNMFEQLKSFCKTNLKTNGKTKRIYSYSKNSYEGRLYSGGSIQGISSIIRGFLMKEITTDIDMSNSFANIIRYVCKKHNISTPELEYYINHRDECLSKFENRQDGKQAYISSAYSDKFRDKIKIPEFRKFDKEMKEIQKKIILIEEYKQIVSSVPEEKENKLGSAFNRIIIFYENQILQYLVQFFANNNIEICTLMFDGLLIYGDYYNDQELIDNITAYIEKQMPGLNMKWAYKEHDNTLKIPDNFDPKIEIIFNSFVKNDLEAAEKLYSLYPDWKYSEGELNAFDDEDGMWKSDRNTFNKIVSRFTNQLWVAVKNRNDKLEASKVKSYGNTTFLFNQMLEKLKILCVDDKWLFRSYSSSLGKLLFNNGYFDMKTNEFHSGFNKDIVFSGKIPHDYKSFTIKDDEYIESIKRRLFYEPLGKEVGDYFILNLARGLAGDRMKRIFFGLGFSNTGKSTVTKALIKTCGDYVGIFDGNNLAYRNTSADSASQNRWMMLLKDKRLIFSNEIKSTIPLNGNLIKVVSSGGDAVIGRNHRDSEKMFYLSFLCIVFANDLPRIVPYDDAVSNRVRVVSYEKIYSEDPNEYELKSDPEIEKEFETLKFQRCFMEIFLRQYWKWMNGEYKSEPAAVIQAKKDWFGDEIGCLPVFLEEYEITDNANDYVISSEIQEWLEEKKIGITMKKFGMEIKRYILKNNLRNVRSDVKRICGINKNIWIGIKYLSEP